MRNLRRGVQIVVGTPGRLNDHLRRKTLNLKGVKTLVLDEADIMLDMGFKEEIDEILEFTPEEREIWLFSATVKSGISDIMSSHMKNPESVRVSKKGIATSATRHYYAMIPMRSRLNALCRFIESAPHFYGFVFCQTKLLTSEIAEQLLLRGYRVGALHGDMSQSQRNAVISRFKAKEVTILVATDVAARGIDIANLTHVINYSLSEDLESYVHRTGRTGRAGREGIAITFINKGDLRDIQLMQRKFNLMIEPIDVPTRETIIKARVQEVGEYLASVVERTPIAEKTLNELVGGLTEEQRKNSLTQILFDKFLKSIYEEEEFGGTPSLDQHRPERSAMGRTSNEFPNAREVFMPVGLDDGLDNESIMQFLMDHGVKADDVYKIRVIKRRTFMFIAKDKISELMEAVNNQTLGGRRVRLSLAESNEDQDRGGGRRDGGRDQGRGGYSRGGRYEGGSRGGGYRGGRR